VLDAAYADGAALRSELERRLGGRVLHCVVTDVDYVAGTTKCDVRFRVAESAGGGYALNGRGPATQLTIVSHART
jgi:hypothetical protein